MSISWGWLIPAAAVVQAIATIVLVCVTVRYVRLTKQLVDTSRDQLSDARAILEAQTGIGRARLLAISERLLGALDGLPSDQHSLARIKRSSIWSIGDEERFLELATAVRGPHVDRAPDTVLSLSWIRQLYARATTVDERLGYRWSDRESAEYLKHHQTATGNLRAVIEAINV